MNTIKNLLLLLCISCIANASQNSNAPKQGIKRAHAAIEASAAAVDLNADSDNKEGQEPKAKKARNEIREKAKGIAKNATPKDGGFECPLCAERKSAKNNLITHIMRHITKSSSTANVGEAETKKLKKEMRKKAKDIAKNATPKDGGFECPQCKKRMSNYETLLRHIINIHLQEDNNGTSPYKCEICNREFNIKEYLRDHKKRNHKEGVLISGGGGGGGGSESLPNVAAAAALAIATKPTRINDASMSDAGPLNIARVDRHRAAVGPSASAVDVHAESDTEEEQPVNKPGNENGGGGGGGGVGLTPKALKIVNSSSSASAATAAAALPSSAAAAAPLAMATMPGALDLMLDIEVPEKDLHAMADRDALMTDDDRSRRLAFAAAPSFDELMGGGGGGGGNAMKLSAVASSTVPMTDSSLSGLFPPAENL